jgi:large subunit ribosomal protein L4
MEVKVLNMRGEAVGSVTIDRDALGGDINAALIKQAYVKYHAGRRQGSSKTKNRREVEGSTKKLYKQKGTGNARHGDKKVNLFKGGGHGHSKKKTREDFRLGLPKKMARKANRNALLAKLVDDQVRVIDRIEFAEPGTKLFKSFLESIRAGSSALVALASDGDRSRNARLSGRNVEAATLCRADSLNCFDMLNHRFLVIEKDQLEAWLKGPSSQTGKAAKVSPMGRAAPSGEPEALSTPRGKKKPPGGRPSGKPGETTKAVRATKEAR